MKTNIEVSFYNNLSTLMQEIMRCNIGQRNEYIESLIGDNHSEECLSYIPYNVGYEIIYTNIILRKIIGDNTFIWCKNDKNDKKYSNSFGKTQYFNNNKYTFEKIHCEKTTTRQFWENRDGREFSIINRIQTPMGLIPREYIAISNIWIVINNPNNSKLCALIDDITFETSFTYKQYSSMDIENEINLLAYMFCIDGISYRNNKIYIPLILPYNCFIFNNVEHDSMISVVKNGINVEFEAWGNITDSRTLPLKKRWWNHMDMDYVSVFYETQYREMGISVSSNKIEVRFRHPTYAIYIMNISKEKVKYIKLFLSNTEYNDFKEYPSDIEWIGNTAIFWINRLFLLKNELHNNINFDRFYSHLIIDNEYYETQNIEVVALNFTTIKYEYGRNNKQHTG